MRAGQLAGARWGASAIPVAGREQVVAGERIVSLARGLFVAGGADAGSAAWAHDQFVHAWWVEGRPPRRRALIAGAFGTLTSMSRLDRITSDPSICHGQPTIRGLRYPVENLVELLASGMSIEEISEDYPDLDREDLLAALEFGALASGMRRGVPLGAGTA